MLVIYSMQTDHTISVPFNETCLRAGSLKVHMIYVRTTLVLKVYQTTYTVSDNDLCQKTIRYIDNFTPQQLAKLFFLVGGAHV